MHLLVTGATGFVGRFLVPALLASGHQVRLFLRPGVLTPALPQSEAVEIAIGSLETVYTLRQAMRGVEGVVHLATGEHQRKSIALYRVDVLGTRALVAAAREAGVRYFFYLSHLGAHPESVYPVLRAKGQAELAVRHSGLNWLIVRTAWMYGPRDHFLSPLLRWFRRMAWFPLPGGGETRVQPLWIEDGVTALSLLITQEETGQVLELGGPEPLTWRDVFTLAAHAVGRRARFWYLPMPYARMLTWWLAAFSSRFLPWLYWLDYMMSDRVAPIDVLPRRFGLLPERLHEKLPQLASTAQTRP